MQSHPEALGGALCGIGVGWIGLGSGKKTGTMRLADGSRVVVVGGGPAGSFAALHLLRLARQAERHLDVIVLEHRNFDRPGPIGCNKCAGILSSTLVHSLEGLGLSLPGTAIQSEVEAYVLHLGGLDLAIRRPEATRRIVSIYRGGGPRWGDRPYPQSFDSWLLGTIKAEGAEVRAARVRTIQRARRPLVFTNEETLEADLVVVATGVNAHNPVDASWGYRPPRTEIMAQDEVALPAGRADGSVHIFFERPAGLIFGGLIPKGRYANISLLGRGLPTSAMADFLESDGLTTVVPAGTPTLCGCAPHVSVSSARNFFADRLVVVGDAAVTRLYKDGIGAAFATAEAAARTAFQRGVSRQDFASGYHPVCRRIETDNLYGRLLFILWALTRRSSFLLETWRRAILAEAKLAPSEQVHIRVLWGMFTGDESYRQIARLSMRARAMRGLWHGALEAWKHR